MRVLLDTHAVLWALGAPDRLGSDARALIEDRGTELLVSAASACEISTKARLGKLPGGEGFTDGYLGHLQRLGAVELPVSARHALLAGALNWDHRDPFDRMLAAQALLEEVPLLTSDAAFSHLAALRLRW